MSTVFTFIVLGLGSGAVYALVALGLVIVYRGSGVVNFSHGAFALTGSAVFYELRQQDWPVIPAIAVGTLACAFVGALVQWLVMRQLRRASPLVRLIATLAILALGVELWTRRYPQAIPPKQFLPDSGVKLLGATVPESRLYLLGIAVALGTGLWLLYRNSRFGLATSAVAENEDVAEALAWSPTLIATANWAIGAGVAGFSGALLFGLLGVSPIGHVLLVVPALAAALIGGFKSFPITLLGGLALGVMNSLASRYLDGDGFRQGLSQAVPLLIIIGVLIVRGRALPLRSYAADRLPTLGTGRIRPPLVVAGVALFAISPFLYGKEWASALYVASYMGLIALSLVVVTGFAGQLSLVQVTLAGVGSILVGRLAAGIWGLPTWLALIVGVLLTVPGGMLVALPALRVRGVNLAIVTLALAAVIDAMVMNNEKVTRDGFSPAKVPSPSMFGIDLNRTAHPERFAVFAIALFALAALVTANVRRGALGRRMIAVRGNEQAAASLGIGVAGVKLFAFAVAAGIAAISGAVVAYANPTLAPSTTFPQLKNIDVVLASVLGGIGYVGGAIVGGMTAPASGIETIVGQVVDPRGWWQLIAVSALILIIIAQPNGAVASILSRVTGRRDRGARPMIGVVAALSVIALIGVHREWNEAGLTGVNFADGKVSRVLLVIAVVGCLAALRWPARRLIPVGLAVLAAVTTVLVRTVATKELAFDDSWKLTVAATTVAFVLAALVVVRSWLNSEARSTLPSISSAAVARVAPKTLSLQGLTVRFGTFTALSEVDLEVVPGQVHGLIGPNGAGKTTLIEATTGFVSATGKVAVDGVDVTQMSAAQRARLGIARSFQSLELFEDMTVFDNLRTAADKSRLQDSLRDLIWPRNRPLSTAASAAVEEFQLADVLHLQPSELPYAKRRTVAIARALAAEPSIILLDEPAAGLDDVSTRELEVLIRRLADDWGMAVLVIEHDVGLVRRVCDVVTALDFGQVIGHGTPAEITANPAVVAAYLGDSNPDLVDAEDGMVQS